MNIKKFLTTLLASFAVIGLFVQLTEQQSIQVVSAQSVAFNDLKEDHVNFPAISWLRKNKVIEGYSDNTFKPNAMINRAELMKVLVEGMGITPDSSQFKNCFPDVKEDWYAKYVCYAKGQNWVQGYPDGTFKPAQNVIDVEAVKMVLEAQKINLNVEGASQLYGADRQNEWFFKYLLAAEKKNLSSHAYKLGANVSRGDVSELIYRTLAVKLIPVTSFDQAAGTAMNNVVLPRGERVEEEQYVGPGMNDKLAFIEGSVNYPSEEFPGDLLICAKNLGSGVEYCTDKLLQNSKFEGGFGYRLQVVSGNYHVFATAVESTELKAYYTLWAFCGMHEMCEEGDKFDVLEIEAEAQKTIDNVEVIHWDLENNFKK